MTDLDVYIRNIRNSTEEADTVTVLYEKSNDMVVMLVSVGGRDIHINLEGEFIRNTARDIVVSPKGIKLN